MPYFRGVGLLRAILSVFVVIGLSAGSAQAAPPLETYGRLPGFEMAALSPTGDHVAMIGVVDQKRRLIITDAAGKPVFVAPFGDMKVRGLSWAGDNMVLVRKSDTVGLDPEFTVDKTELQSMMVIPIDGGKPWSVFEGAKLITGGIRGFYGVCERNGRWYGYFGGITLESDGKGTPWLRTGQPNLYEVDLQTHQNRRIAARYDTDSGYRSWLIGPDGSVSATFDFQTNGGQWRIRNATNVEIATGVNALGDIELIGLGAEPGMVIYADTDEETGERTWFQLPLAGGKVSPIFDEESVNTSYFDNRSRQLLGYEHHGDVPSYRFLDVRQNKVIAATLKAFPGLSVHLIDWNDRFDRLIVQTEGGTDPMTWWLVDIKTGDAQILGTSYPIPDADVAPTRVIHYKAADGLEIAAVLTLPPGKPEKNLPVLVLPHGGPTARDYPGFDWWAQAFASRGYAVFQPNFRGSSGYGRAFEKAGNGEWGRKMQTDISDGLAQLIKDGIVDGKRACIMGGSYGGYAALAGVTLQQGLYRCAVSVAGVSDVRKMTQTDLNRYGHSQTMRRALAQEVGSGRDLDAISPIRFAEKADAPIMLIHGKDDTVVEYNQSTAMAAALTRAGRPVEFVSLLGEDHHLSRGETRLAMLRAAMAFVQNIIRPTHERRSDWR